MLEAVVRKLKSGPMIGNVRPQGLYSKQLVYVNAFSS